MTTGADGLRVDVQRLDPEMPLPAYAHPGDAGIDLYARESIVIRSGGGRVLMPTGIAIAIPLGWAGFVLPRSGLALKHGLSVVNSPGLIDSAYRGELKVVLINTDPTDDYEVTLADALQHELCDAVAACDLVVVGWVGVNEHDF